jgi:predicted Zn-dependent protease
MMLTNCREPALRNPSLAVQDALAALTLVREQGEFGADWIARKYLGALAEAHAAAGDLDAAIEVQRSLLPYALTRVSDLRVQERLREMESLRENARPQSSAHAGGNQGRVE